VKCCVAVPAPVSPLVGFLLGVAFAWAAAAERGRAHPAELAARSVTVVALFSLLLFAPVSAYFLAFAPDWSYAYLIDTHRLPGATDLIVVLLDVASVPLGFVLGARRMRERRPGAVVRLAALPCLAAVAVLIVALPRLSVHATYAQYHGDFGVRSVAGSPLGYALLWMDSVLTGGVLWTAHALRRLGSATGAR
jgi:hypothetical protein